jgi:uncharacterized protein YqjF (DUF2071 family)
MSTTRPGYCREVSGARPEEVVRRPVVQQAWRRLSFLHWRIDPAAIATRLPEHLEPDVLDGTSWVGLTPFEVHRFRVLNLPPAPARLSSFPETNLRTYVRHRDGTDGLWFLSLDVSSSINALGGRCLNIPYFRSTMSVQGQDVVRYRARRLGSRVRHDLAVQPGETINPDDLTARLTGRWRAFTSLAGHCLAVPVEHGPWPLRGARIVALDENLLSGAGLTPLDPEPLVHFSDGVDARLGMPRPCRPAKAGADPRRRP